MQSTGDTALFAILVTGFVAVMSWMFWERARHTKNLQSIPCRIVINGIRGKSSITRLVAGGLRRDDGLVVAAKTTGTAARFIYPQGREVPLKRRYGVVNVIEQVGVVERAAGLRANVLVAECMAVQPTLQELNQQVLIQATLVVISNVRADHLDEMGPSLDDVARSLALSMPHDGIVVTGERERFGILAEEATRRNTAIYYADPDTVTDDEMAGFTWITFKENVAIALLVAHLCGVPRHHALQGMYEAAPDPGVLRVDAFTRGNRLLHAVNLFAANDPESTLMNYDLLRQRGLIQRHVVVVINCRPDRVERNMQMGDIVATLDPDRVVVIGTPTRSAEQAVAPSHRDRVERIDGDHDGEYLLDLITRDLPDTGVSIVMIGNIHGMGEVLLHAMHTDQQPIRDNDLDLEMALLTSDTPTVPIPLQDIA